MFAVLDVCCLGCLLSWMLIVWVVCCLGCLLSCMFVVLSVLSLSSVFSIACGRHSFFSVLSV